MFLPMVWGEGSISSIWTCLAPAGISNIFKAPTEMSKKEVILKGGSSKSQIQVTWNSHTSSWSCRNLHRKEIHKFFPLSLNLFSFCCNYQTYVVKSIFDSLGTHCTNHTEMHEDCMKIQSAWTSSCANHEFHTGPPEKISWRTVVFLF